MSLTITLERSIKSKSFLMVPSIVFLAPFYHKQLGYPPPNLLLLMGLLMVSSSYSQTTKGRDSNFFSTICARYNQQILNKKIKENILQFISFYYFF